MKSFLVRLLPVLLLFLPTHLPAIAAAPSAVFFAETGFTVADDGQTKFLSDFQRLGAVVGLGYPISRPYMVDGFRYQAFQRAILQWRPELGRSLLANTLNWLSDTGRGDWLDSIGVPRPLRDSGGSWAQVVAERESWLTEPAIARVYREGGGMDRFGLPLSYPERRGPFTVQRFQRIAFQLWEDPVSGMPAPGSVVGILAGDMAKGAGLIPAEALAADGAASPPHGATRPSSPAPPPPGNWLAYLNYYRALAALPPVEGNAAWSDGDVKHARYMVKTNIMQHSEDPNSQWYTPEGLAAAQSGNIMAGSATNTSDEEAIDWWMEGPFHALGILDPKLLQVGYGSYREADGGLQMAATLDVLRGQGGVPPSTSFPIMWPADGMTVPIRSFGGGESPNPLTSCPGYGAPAGLPIILQLGPGNLTPVVTARSFTQDGTPLETCVLTETSYANPDGPQQNLGRLILNSRDAVVLVPRAPLTPGASYAVSITANGQTYTWSLTVSPSAR